MTGLVSSIARRYVEVMKVLVIMWLLACNGSTSGPPDARRAIDGRLADAGGDAGSGSGSGSDAAIDGPERATMYCAALLACCGTLTGLDHDNCVDAYDASGGYESACRGFLESIQNNGACT